VEADKKKRKPETSTNHRLRLISLQTGRTNKKKMMKRKRDPGKTDMLMGARKGGGSEKKRKGIILEKTCEGLGGSGLPKKKKKTERERGVKSKKWN